MHQVKGYLELSALNSEIAAAYLKDAEDELSAVVEKLENSLGLVKKLRRQSADTECNSSESWISPSDSSLVSRSLSSRLKGHGIPQQEMD